jgi:hypothetical protein
MLQPLISVSFTLNLKTFISWLKDIVESVREQGAENI